MRQTIIWLSALVIGAILGALGQTWINETMNFLAGVFTRLFQFIALPTIALALISTLASLGRNGNTGKIFRHTITYTLLTTIASASVGLLLYLIIAPESLPKDIICSSSDNVVPVQELSYVEHLLRVVPSNIIVPFAEGNVLSVLLIAMAIGLGLAFLQESDGKRTVISFFIGLQELFHSLIRALIKLLPLGIVAFTAQLTAQMSAGVVVGALGQYTAVIIGGNVLQALVVLPLFLLLNGLNPIKVMRTMSPAVIMAFFTKSSAATLPVTIQSAEERLGVKKEVARFVLPICTTINMNGCAAFILVTSLYVMQHSIDITPMTMLLWLFIAVFSAVGNAGVPMGCYFLTLSLTASMPGANAIMAIILPLFAIIDMVETAENVWSDSCVCAMTNQRLNASE